LVILQVLWKRDAATVRQIYDELSRTRTSGYNSVLKLIQIMTDKGYVRRRDESERPQVYQATLTEQENRRNMLRDLMERVFGGSAQQLILQALSLKRPTSQELKQLRAHLDRLARPPRGAAGENDRG
jgi:predicted transcriptional regulator